jgi:hypothetical protein
VACSHRRISPRGWLGGGGEGWAAVVLPVVCRLGERKEEELLKMVADKWVLIGKFNRIKKKSKFYSNLVHSKSDLPGLDFF